MSAKITASDMFVDIHFLLALLCATLVGRIPAVVFQEKLPDLDAETWVNSLQIIQNVSFDTSHCLPSNATAIKNVNNFFLVFEI